MPSSPCAFSNCFAVHLSFFKGTMSAGTRVLLIFVISPKEGCRDVYFCFLIPPVAVFLSLISSAFILEPLILRGSFLITLVDDLHCLYSTARFSKNLNILACTVSFPYTYFQLRRPFSYTRSLPRLYASMALAE